MVNKVKNMRDIDTKLEDIRSKIHNVDLTQTRMESDLRYHIRRTDLLEENFKLLHEKFKPIEAVRFTWFNIVKITVFFAAIGTIATAVINYARYVK